MNLLEEKERISKILASAKHNLYKAPEGELVISKSHNRIQYYHRGKTCERTYLGKDKITLLKALAQKEYDLRIIKAMPTEIARLEKFINYYNSEKAIEIYEQFPPDLKKLIKPHEITNEQYAAWWSEQEYQTKGVNKGDIFFTTDNGECVRSKSELTIANKLYHRGVKYRYEDAHYMKGYGTVYPDFTILNAQTRKEILWEHFGLMDNPDYVHSSLLKLNTYAKNGIFPGNGLIITYESKDLPLDTKMIDTLIDSLVC